MRLSVCIPVHNGAPYIERCARSLFGQSYADIQFIFVDDASTDDGVDVISRVLRDYPSREGSVRILRHAGQQGAMASRLEGMKAATGELLAFCDADDWVDYDYFEKQAAAFSASDVDMTFAPMVRNENRPMRGMQNLAFVGDGFDYLDAVGRVVAFDSMVNKVYRRSCLMAADLQIPCGVRIGEDTCFVVQVAARCRQICGVTGTRYHYRMNEESVSRTFDARKAVDDLCRVQSLLFDILPPGRADIFRRHHLRELRFLGMRLGVLSRRECRDLLAQEDALGTRVALPGENFVRRVVLSVSQCSYALAAAFCIVLRLKGRSGI